MSVRPERTVFDPETGRRSGTVRGLYVKFVKGAAPQYARDIARNAYTFNGYPQGVDPVELIAFLDLDVEKDAFGWTDDEYQLVLQHVQNIPGVFEVEKPKAQKPWPNYDTLTAKQNLDLARQTGVPVDRLLAYEQDTLARPQFLSEFTKVLDELAELEVTVTA